MKYPTIETFEQEMNGVKLEVNNEEKNVRIFLPENPDPKKKIQLLKAGFYWKPGAWTAPLSYPNIYHAYDIVG